MKIVAYIGESSKLPAGFDLSAAWRAHGPFAAFATLSPTRKGQTVELPGAGEVPLLHFSKAGDGEWADAVILSLLDDYASISLLFAASIPAERILVLRQGAPRLLSTFRAEAFSKRHEWLALKDLHRGRRAFILGNGPSLKVEDLDKLKGEITFASNKIYLAFEQTEWRPTYYTVCDQLVAKYNAEQICKMDSMALFPSTIAKLDCGFKNGLWYEERFENKFISELDEIEREGSRLFFSPDMRLGAHGGYSVIFQQMQLAFHMGVREVYLIGLDFHFVVPEKVVEDANFASKNYRNALESQGEVNHFHKDYRKPGEKWSMPRLDLQTIAFAEARRAFEAAGGKLVNASRQTALTALPRCSFDKLVSAKTASSAPAVSAKAASSVCAALGKRPLVSVLINNYNYGRYVGEAIQSALDQSYPKIEIVVVDDGSTDGSTEVINSYAKRYPGRVVPVFKANGGQASAMNAGFNVSHGQIICFLDSDDYWFGRKVESVIEPHRRFGIVQHDLLQNSRRYRLLLNTGDLQRFLKEFGLTRSCVPTSAMSFRRDLLEKFFPMPELEPMRLCADVYLRCAAVYFGQTFSLDERHGTYRLHGSNGWYDNLRITRPKIIDEIVAILNKDLVAKGLAPIPACPDAREKSFLESVPCEPGKSYVFYGAGDLGGKLARHIEAKGCSVIAFCDNKPEKWGTTLLGKPVCAPSKLLELRSKADKIVVACTFVESVYERLCNMGFKFPDDILLPIDTEGHVRPPAAPLASSNPAPRPADPKLVAALALLDQICQTRRTDSEVMRHVVELGYKPQHVIDVGVAYGTPWLYNAFPKSNFLLVEPLAEFEPDMKKIAESYKVDYEIAGAAAEDGNMQIAVSPDLTGSTITGEKISGSVFRTVPVCKLDTLCGKYGISKGPLVLKIDVQGGELEVLKGSTRILQFTDIVFMEVSLFDFSKGFPSFKDVILAMDGYGFVPYEFYGGHNRPLDFALAQTDVMFVRKDGVFRTRKEWATPEQTLRFHEAKRIVVAANSAAAAPAWVQTPNEKKQEANTTNRMAPMETQKEKQPFFSPVKDNFGPALTPADWTRIHELEAQGNMYHQQRFPDGVGWNGRYDMDRILKSYHLPEDFSGMSVLEIGPADGYFSFLAEQRHAKSVTAIQIAQPFAGLIYAHRHLQSKVKFCNKNIYELNNISDDADRFDCTFCFSVLLHIPDLYSAITGIAKATRKVAYIATSIDENAELPPLKDKPYVLFHGESRGDGIKGGAYHIYWYPNTLAMINMAKLAGFTKVEALDYFYLSEALVDTPRKTSKHVLIRCEK